MSRQLLLAFSLAFAIPSLPRSSAAQSETVVSWFIGDATQVTGNSPTYSDLDSINATTSIFSFAGVTATSGTDNGWTNWSVGSIDTGKYLEYRIAVRPGFRVALDSLIFGYSSTAGNMVLTARGSTDNFTSDLSSQSVTSGVDDTTWSIPLTGTVVQGGVFTVRIYGVADSSSTRLSNNHRDESGGFSLPFSARFQGSISDLRKPSLTVGKKFESPGPSFLLKGESTNVTAIRWSLNGAKSKTQLVRGSAWKIRVSPLRTGTNTVSLTPLNTNLSTTGKSLKVKITR
jgi:hypothetical protein